MPIKKKVVKKRTILSSQKQKKRLKFKGVIGDGILWGIILGGLVLMGFYFAGSALPQQRTTGEGLAIVTLLPQQKETAQGKLQMSYFDGITGLPTPTPKKSSGGCNGGSVQVGNTELFVGDYETGDYSQWSGCQFATHNGGCGGYRGSYSAQLVSGAEACQGQYASRFQLTVGEKERSEVMSDAAGALVHEGDERWYEFSLKFPDDFVYPCGQWFIVTQWHAGNGSPPMAIEANCEGKLEIRNNRDNAQVYEIGDIELGQWMDLVIHAKFSNSKSNGFIEVWLNGEQTIPLTPFQNMASNENYFKQGIYQGGNSGTFVVYDDGLRITGP